MDLLYSKYSNPLEFMKIYIDQGRFGEFVDSILNIEMKKRKEEAEKDDENKMFDMYIHSLPDKSFIEWKNEVLGQSESNVKKKSLSMTDDEVEDAKRKSRNILKGFNIK